MRINQFWSVAGPGKVLCLLDGTYLSGNALIEPPTTLHGTQAQPITVRALNDGKVLLDGQGHWVVRIRSNWFVLEGFNARNGSEFLLLLSGQHNRGRRVVGWDGQAGQGDSNIFRAIGTDNVWEDCAGWGNNSRKIFDGAQAGNVGGSGYRRCWGEFNDWPGGASWPTNTYQGGYNTTNQLFENVIGTWHTTGDVKEPEAVIRYFKGHEQHPNAIEGSKVLGSIFYVRRGARYEPGQIVATDGISGLLMRDVVAYVAPGFPQVEPFAFMNNGCSGSDPCVNNRCENCLAIHDGNASSNQNGAGWTLPGFREGNGLQAATSGISAFTLLPGICYRSVNGETTNKPLWPWPMDDRIHEARALSGKAPVVVTEEIASLLGPIPVLCMNGGPTDTTPPTGSITEPLPGAVLTGEALVAIAAEDMGGIAGVQLLVDGQPVGSEDTTAPYGASLNTAALSNGLHALTARIRDSAGNLFVTAPVSVSVLNLGGATLAATPLIVIPGGIASMAWSGIPTPSSTDWVGLYVPGAAHSAFLAWRYTTGQASGTVPFTLPASTAPGIYEVRLMSNDGFTHLATSPPVTIAAACMCPCAP